MADSTSADHNVTFKFFYEIRRTLNNNMMLGTSSLLYLSEKQHDKETLPLLKYKKVVPVEKTITMPLSFTREINYLNRMIIVLYVSANK